MRFAPPLPLLCLTIAGSLLVSLPLAGCAGNSRREKETKRKATAAAPTPTPEVHVPIGEVAVVNAEKHFVLVDLGSNLYVPDPGTPLRVLREGVVIAQLQASPEQKRPFVAADILQGQPAVGDRVER